MTTAFSLSHISKQFKRQLALDDVSLSSGPGVVVALLGENGAGKSTALRILLGLLEPDAGESTVLGMDSRRQGLEIRRRVGYVPDQPALYDWMTVEEAGWFVVFTRVDKKPGREGIGCVLVEKGTPGFTVTGSYHTMGGENLHEIRFEDVELPPENLVLEDGFRKLLGAFNTQRCLNPSISLGLAEGALEEAVKYVKERRAFGRPIADFQGIRWKIAEMYRDIEASRSILYRACASADPFPDPILAASAKITCNEMALRVTSEAIQVHGGYGFTEEFPVSRFYRGARYGTLGGGTTETLKDLIGRRVLAGIDPVDGILGLGAF